ncbi:putative negative transcriptional regulator [Mobilicoccus pelagius NBRC 104925]|uniref:Putative negative transcriptional regulator n=1 Tax=Mobilicoccus pelagius NBRC 104925 TaxID=1089455 RepID=H5UT75_9MICO|nr:putative negative transcriptional regulator [Mobilicoccus pelagius NBRC 104925]
MAGWVAGEVGCGILVGVYVPAHFALTDAGCLRILARMGAGDLVTVHAGDDGMPEPDVTFLPWEYVPAPAGEPDGEVTDASESIGLGSLVGHLARNNLQVRRPVLGPATVVVHEGDHYVSPVDLPSHDDGGRVVPTWDYVTVHAHGELVLHDDPAWILATMRPLTDRHEHVWAEAVPGMPATPGTSGGAGTTWSVDDAPQEFVDRMLRAVVGVELRLGRVVGKAKMSQNKTPADVAGEIDALEARGRDDLAAFKREVSLPAAQRRHDLLADLRKRR